MPKRDKSAVPPQMNKQEVKNAIGAGTLSEEQMNSFIETIPLVDHIESTYCNPLFQNKLSDSIFTSSVSRNPLAEDSLEHLITILKNPELKFYSKYAAVEQYVLWAKHTFPQHPLSEEFCEYLEKFLEGAVSIKEEQIKKQSRIKIIIHLNGTNNPSMCKKNVHVEMIEQRLETENAIYLEVPGVASDKSERANPQNLLLDLITSVDLNDDPLKLKELIPDLKKALAGSFSLASLVGVNARLKLKSWAESGEGVFSQTLYSLQKIIEIQKLNPDLVLDLEFWGHSRGAVGSLLSSHEIQRLIDKKVLHKGTTIEHYLSDPVPGGDKTKENYEMQFKDSLHDTFRKVHQEPPTTLVATLKKKQPVCVKKAVTTFAQNESRHLYDEVCAEYPETTQVIRAAVPGPHSFLYGSFPLSIFNIGFRESSSFISNIGTESHTNAARDKVREHYKEILEYLFAKDELSKAQLRFTLLANYGKFLVEGFDKFTLSQKYMPGQASQVRKLDPQVLPTPGYEILFYDRFHETLFRDQFPTLAAWLGVLQGVGSEKFKGFYNNDADLSGEFKQLPRSMQYIYLNWVHSGLQRQKPKSTKRTAIDTLGLGYVTAGLIGNSGRRHALALREKTDREGLSLKTKSNYLKLLRELGADNKADTERHTRKYEPHYKYGEKNDIVWNVDPLLDRSVEISALRKAASEPYVQNKLEEEMELINSLFNYVRKRKETPPTPVYFFKHKAPHLLDAYLASPVLQANWYSKKLNNVEPSVSKQLVVLSFREFVDSNSPVDAPSVQTAPTSSGAEREPFLQAFTRYCNLEKDVDKALNASHETFHDIDDRPREVLKAVEQLRQKNSK